MKRSFRFWFRFSGQVFLIALIAAVIIAVSFGARLDLATEKLGTNVLPIAVCLGGTFGLLICGCSVHLTYLPLMLAWGETRKNLLYGLLGYIAAVPLTLTAFCGLLWLIQPGADNWIGNLPVALLFSLTGALAGNLLGIVYARFRMIGLIIIGCFSGLLSGAFTYVTYDGITGGFVNFLHGNTMMTILLVAAAVLLVLNLPLSWLRLRKLEVKL